MKLLNDTLDGINAVSTNAVQNQLKFYRLTFLSSVSKYVIQFTSFTVGFASVSVEIESQ